jgi:hypothetical protein
MTLNNEQKEALQAIVDYVLEAEYSHFLDYLEEDGNPVDHIYSKAIILQNLEN